jgi:flagellar export protein FliJ
VKKFEFRLAAVLKLRDTQLTIEKNKLQQLFAERQKLEKNLASIEAERNESLAWIQTHASAGSADLRALSAFLLGSQARQAMVKHAIESCQAEIEEQQSRTLAAERARKLLLNLRDQRRAEWQKDFDKELEAVAQDAWQSAARSAADRILSSKS